MLKALIVEDEYPARMELRFQLEPYRHLLEVVGEAQSAREAEQLIAALDYDVIFLDVQMPGMSGIDLARRLKRERPDLKVVLVTAYERYAVQAFDAGVVDYLLKPVSAERLKDTISRLTGRGAGEAASRGEPAGPPLTFVPCESGDTTIPVAVDEIVFVTAEHETILVCTQSERLPTRFTLQELAERLPADRFFRTHRSFIANIRQVREIMPYFNGTYLLKMKDKAHSEVVVSRSNVKRLKELFNLA
ncbi:Two component transcriptional regulator, LytTR family [Candidatus Hydrogenisulfobacillus filiaventi]|uniref:Stage 0 sporulation protein A homolog n=1 Tax=Candidatus Hydrogenisulfobacillus filiaventi TaxID=2707344 RepID=A0A6F8ZJI3_9FIRM|nr:Two component transcriptional regulator, LytTR family [Candidatus Hydrogenisulfobacillus filiaventi]